MDRLFGHKLPPLVVANLDEPPLYRSGDILGQVLAYVSLAPAFHIFYRGSLLYHERNWTQLENCLGAFSNAVLSKVLKAIFKIQRPASTCEELGLCHEMGMPSTHCQIMSFAFTSMLLQIAGSGRAGHRLEVVLCTILVVAVAWSRFYLGYHDVAQISAGIAVGAAAAAAWHCVVQQGLIRKPLQHVLQRLWPTEHLRME